MPEILVTSLASQGFSYLNTDQLSFVDVGPAAHCARASRSGSCGATAKRSRRMRTSAGVMGAHATDAVGSQPPSYSSETMCMAASSAEAPAPSIPTSRAR